MMQWPLLALALFGARLEGLRLAATGSLEELIKPKGAKIWREGTFEAGWAGGRLDLGVGVKQVRRYGVTDEEWSMSGGWGWNDRFSSQAALTIGQEQIYLASWALNTSTLAKLSGGWIVEGKWKMADYRGFVIHQPGFRFERYLGAWRMGMGVGFPWYNGALPQLTGRGAVGWDWSDFGGVGIDFAADREAENSEKGVIDRSTISGAIGIRQTMGKRIVVRASGTWTQLADIQQRLGVGLGIEYRLGH